MLKALQKSTPLFLSTLVFIDLETTGLPTATFQPEITELCILAVSRFSLENSRSQPRVENKLTLCFHPSHTISSIASKISGLNEDNLFHQKDFDSSAVDLIQLFIHRLDPPVCMLAHNGLHFDFPLLRAQILGVKDSNYKLTDCSGDPIFCSDTLFMFKEFSSQVSGATSLDDSGFLSAGEQEVFSNRGDKPLSQSSPKKVAKPTESFRLGDVFMRVFGSSHENAHSAEGDCRAMLQLVGHLGVIGLDWLQSHYVNFDLIPPMYNLPRPSRNLFSNLFPYRRKTFTMDSKSITDASSALDDIHLK